MRARFLERSRNSSPAPMLPAQIGLPDRRDRSMTARLKRTDQAELTHHQQLQDDIVTVSSRRPRNLSKTRPP